MGAFPSIDVYFYWPAYIIEIYVYNSLIIACVVKSATGVLYVFMSHPTKKSLSFGFLFFESFSFVYRHCNQLGNLAFRTNGVEDTQLTLAATPF